MALATTVNLTPTAAAPSAVPAPPTGQQAIVFANDGGAPTVNFSATDPVMEGDSGAGGLAGNVPAPAAGDAAAGKFLKADRTWAVPAGIGISQLTGDVTAGPGSGSQAATLAASGVSAGSYTSANITVDAKGRLTAAANGTGAGTFLEEVITFTGTAGAFSHAPARHFGLYRNGIRMTSLAGSPAIQTFSAIGTAITLSTAAGGSDVFIAVYQY